MESKTTPAPTPVPTPAEKKDGPVVHTLADIETTPLSRLIRRIPVYRRTSTKQQLGTYISKVLKHDIRETLVTALSWDAELARAEAERERLEKEQKEREEKLKEEQERAAKAAREAEEARKKAEEQKQRKGGKREEPEEKKEKVEEEKKEAPKPPPVSPPKITRGIELESYLSLLSGVFLMDLKEYPKAHEVISDLIAKIGRLPVNKRHDLLEVQAQAYFFLSRIFELIGSLSANRPLFLDAYRVACLHRDELGQVTLINILLRSWMLDNQNRDAIIFAEKTHFPASAPPAQQARHLYYLGRLFALQSDYQHASTSLQLALNKSPVSARGFRLATHKLLCLVELLLGDIPQRQVFRQKGLKPYFELARAVREGRLASFKRVMDDYEKAFEHDEVLNLVIRLRHNAIREGVVQATINHETGFLHALPQEDLYQTFAPEQMMHKRITQCIEARTDLLKSLRYLGVRDRDEEDEQARKEREELEQEVAHLDDFDGDMDEPM
ncbi:putative 26S proteasome non-ATPase regulatory subunit 3 [Paratrimastix pyriformis]|uniref:26S proteasome non-ATPase regulatory subunit 3 n=1 Tax=Paratrimastix pyriformis TaxID=342808 RepID=A0ABQ8UKQ9_9EUKA|nr:putative 26S proteasome non-ATPase regulatory subunit 3 [Paratrimastix pyriformis]